MSQISKMKRKSDHPLISVDHVFNTTPKFGGNFSLSNKKEGEKGKRCKFGAFKDVTGYNKY